MFARDGSLVGIMDIGWVKWDYLDGEEQLNEHEYYRRQKAMWWSLHIIDIDVKMKRNLLLAFTYIYAVIVSDSEPCYTDS